MTTQESVDAPFRIPAGETTRSPWTTDRGVQHVWGLRFESPQVGLWTSKRGSTVAVSCGKTFVSFRMWGFEDILLTEHLLRQITH